MRSMPEATKRARDEFRLEHIYCMSCGALASDVHEICRGPHRARAVTERCTWLLLCRRCHDDMDGYAEWPIEKQLGCKLVHDPNWFDLDRVNEIRGRAPGAITLADIVPYLEVKE